MKKLIVILLFLLSAQMFGKKHQCAVSVEEYFNALNKADNAEAQKFKEIRKYELKLKLQQIENNKNAAIVKALSDRHTKVTYSLISALVLSVGFSVVQLGRKKTAS